MYVKSPFSLSVSVCESLTPCAQDMYKKLIYFLNQEEKMLN